MVITVNCDVACEQVTTRHYHISENEIAPQLPHLIINIQQIICFGLIDAVRGQDRASGYDDMETWNVDTVYKTEVTGQNKLLCLKKILC